MKLEHKILTVAVCAIVLAVPIAIATQHRTNLLKLERADNSNLHLQLKTKSEELQLKNTQLEQERQKAADQQKQIDDQKKALQAKATAKAAAQLVAYKTPNCASYQGLVAQYDWDVHTAMAIMQAESGCRAITPSNAAINYDGVSDFGLFQLHGIDITDPAQNVAYAYYHKYLPAVATWGNGFHPWNTYTGGAYLAYL